jgi:hypothetical protein
MTPHDLVVIGGTVLLMTVPMSFTWRLIVSGVLLVLGLLGKGFSL